MECRQKKKHEWMFRREIARKSLADGRTAREAAEEAGVCLATVYKVARKNGIRIFGGRKRRPRQ